MGQKEFKIDRILNIEEPINDYDHGISGKIDLICKARVSDKPVIAIIDFKTGIPRDSDHDQVNRRFNFFLTY